MNVAKIPVGVAFGLVLLVAAAHHVDAQILNREGLALFDTLLADEVLHSGIIEENGWRIGRATFYGNEHWAWSIHEGSCGYGYIWEDEPLGWDVAAIPDAHYEFAGSCGTCYEIACAGIRFRDNYDNHLDRANVCHDQSQSVVVRITDTCPCNYVTNAYSNRRWCCGDMDHFDLSVWAFEKLADQKWGVIGLKYRPVPCDYEPPNPAPSPHDAFPADHSKKPAVRPWWLPKKGENPSGVYQNPGGQPSVVPAGSNPIDLYTGEIKAPFWEKSWNSQRTYGWKGPTGGEAFCHAINGYGAMGFASHGNHFSGHVSLEMWVRTKEGVPDVRLQLGGLKGECGMVVLSQMTPSGESNGFSRYTIYLGLFDFGAHHARVMAFASEFRGCGKNDASDVQDLYIRNDRGHSQFVCVDNMQLI